VLAEPHQRPADVVLEHDDHDDDEVVDDVVEQPRHGGQLEALGGEEGGADQDDADHHLGGAGALDREEHPVEQVVDQEDVETRERQLAKAGAADEIDQAAQGKTSELSPGCAPSTEVKAVSAAAIPATSCTRIMWA